MLLKLLMSEFNDEEIFLVAQDQKIDIRTGAELLVQQGSAVEA